MSYGLRKALVLVTGSCGTIGKSVCNLLMLEHSRIIAADIDYNGAKQAMLKLSKDEHLGEDHLVQSVDITNKDSVDQLASSILNHYHEPPCIVIHCAGITGTPGGLLGCELNDWSDVMSVNLTGTYLINKTFINLMVKHGITNGAVVNLASQAAMGLKFAPGYAASKAGVVGLTKSIAKEFGEFGIRANAVAPSFIEGPMSATLGESLLKKTAAITPLRRLGRAEDAANLCLFLASDKASFLTGDVFYLTGGLFT